MSVIVMQITGNTIICAAACQCPPCQAKKRTGEIIIS